MSSIETWLSAWLLALPSHLIAKSNFPRSEYLVGRGLRRRCRLRNMRLPFLTLKRLTSNSVRSASSAILTLLEAADGLQKKSKRRYLVGPLRILGVFQEY